MQKKICLTVKMLIAAAMIVVCGCSVYVSNEGEAYQLSDFNVGRSNFDPQSPELVKRIILLDGGINIESANAVCKQLLYLNNISTTEPITIWLNSTGGDMTAYFEIVNMIQSTPAPVNVVNTGLGASAAAALMQSATGTRYAFADSYFILHSGYGTPKDLRDKCNRYNEELLKKRTKIPREWLPFGNREYTLTAHDALKYGMVDEVIERYGIFDQPDAAGQKTANEQQKQQ